MDNIKIINENDIQPTIYKQEDEKQPFISQILKLKRKKQNNTNNKLVIFVK